MATAFVLEPLGRLVGRPFECFFGAQALLGRVNLSRDRVRTGLTVGGMMIALASVVALGTVALAAASRRAAAGDAAGLDDVLRRGLRLNWLLAVPSGVGLAALAEPLVRLVYERGAFSRDDTDLVAAAVRWYAIGVPMYAGVKVAATAFHARGNTRVPMVASLLGIAVNLGIAVAGVVCSVALATSSNAAAAGSETLSNVETSSAAPTPPPRLSTTRWA